MSIVEDTLLAYENREMNRIQLYDIKNETFFSNINFDRHGDNGIGGIAGFYVKNLDSIYLIGDHRKEIALANADGLVLDRYKFDTRLNFGTVVGISFFPMQLIGQKLYFACLPDFNIYTESSVGQEIEIEFDLAEDTLSYHFFYPEEFEGFHNTYYITYSRAIDSRGRFVYSFPMAHDLYIKDASKGTRKVPAASRYLKKEVQINKNTDHNDLSGELKAYIEGFAYRYIVLDQYRKVFYRFVSHPIDYIDPGTGQERTVMDKPTSIIVLDQDLEVLGETMLEKNKYLVGEGDFFVNSEGLWISNNHNNNPELDEDHLSFTLLVLSAE